MVTMAKEDKTLSLDFKSEDKTLIPILKLTSNEKQWNTVQYPTAIDQSAASIRVKLMIILVILLVKKGYGLVSAWSRPRAIRLAERRYQAVSLFYKEDNEFIISSPPPPPPPHTHASQHSCIVGNGQISQFDLIGKINIVQSWGKSTFIYTQLTAPKGFAKFGWQIRAICHKENEKSGCQTRVRQQRRFSSDLKPTKRQLFLICMCNIPT